MLSPDDAEIVSVAVNSKLRMSLMLSESSDIRTALSQLVDHDEQRSTSAGLGRTDNDLQTYIAALNPIASTVI
jgi:hypothetical protein